MNLLPLLLLSAAAHADCESRAATAAEKAAHSRNLAAFKKAAPPAPKGWAVEGERDAEPLERVCVGAEDHPVKQSFARDYARVDGMAAQESAAVKKIAASQGKHEARRKANAKELASVDAKIDQVQKRLEAAAAKSDMGAIQKAAAEMELLSKRKADLSIDSGAVAEADAGQAEADRDARAAVEFFSNEDGSVSLEDCAPVKLPAPGRACRAKRENGAEETIVLLGPWKVEGSEAVPPEVPEKARGRAHHLSVRVREDGSRKGALARAVDYAALGALLK